VVALISAAGGLVWRWERGQRAVCLVHRPRYDDWSLPKGSVKPGEHPLAAAVREVAEESGLRGVPQLPLPSTRYEVDGVPKVVEYWAMSAPGVEPEFRPNSEVDGIAWLPVAEAVRRVRYPHDAGLLLRWDALPEVTGVVLLVRHAHAGSRSQWTGPDRTRPLSPRGTADADRLCAVLELFAPTRLVTARPDRCRQTVAPLAAARKLPVEVDPAFDEAFDEDGADLAAATARVRQLAGAGGVSAVCTQGAVLPPVLSQLAGDDPAGEAAASTGAAGAGAGSGGAGSGGGGAGRRPEWTTDKGDGWLLSFAGPHLLAVAPLHAQRVRR
jgi:8-oxo-dGTP diphosphatase